MNKHRTEREEKTGKTESNRSDDTSETARKRNDIKNETLATTTITTLLLQEEGGSTANTALPSLHTRGKSPPGLHTPAARPALPDPVVHH